MAINEENIILGDRIDFEDGHMILTEVSYLDEECKVKTLLSWNLESSVFRIYRTLHGSFEGRTFNKAINDLVVLDQKSATTYKQILSIKRVEKHFLNMSARVAFEKVPNFFGRKFHPGKPVGIKFRIGNYGTFQHVAESKGVSLYELVGKHTIWTDLETHFPPINLLPGRFVDLTPEKYMFAIPAIK